MGLFCANFHFRATDDQALTAALKRRGVTRYRVTPAKNGWVSLYEERASEQDDERIRDLAAGLTADLHAAGIAFMVHDSDIACYWLFDDGRLLDEFNSYPNYFDQDGDGPATPSASRPDVLVRYCKTGVRQDDIAAILAGENLFAETIIEQLAEALGIDRGRAIADYRQEGGADGTDDPEDSDDDDGPHSGGPQNVLRGSADLAGRLAKMFGGDERAAAVHPQVIALVQAAVTDDIDEIDRLLAAGVGIDAEAPAPLAGGEAMTGMGHIFPGGVPKVAMTPLMAAVVHKRRRASERLLAGGADPNRVHPLFGTVVHAATGAGNADLLQHLIDRGGDVNARNAKGQAPLDILAAGRATRDRLEQAEAMMKSMGAKFPGFIEQMSKVALPTEGWDACERLLKARIAK